MTPRPVGDDYEDWAECAPHTGSMMHGTVTDLRHAEPKGKPFIKRYGPLGFDITPGQTLRRKRRKRND
jgi:hypothetical protein